MISSYVSVEATKVTYSGKATITTPRISTRWRRNVRIGRFSTIRIRRLFRCPCSVLHLLLDEAELHHRERDDDEHQDHRLRGGAAEVARLHAVVVDLVDEDLGGGGRPALRRGVDHAEGLEERVDDVHHEQEERRGREQRED